jgi:hypothetical protein
LEGRIAAYEVIPPDVHPLHDMDNTEAIAIHKNLCQSMGALTVFAKCSSHGKDKQQHELISLWNSRADKEAELKRQHGLLEQEWWPEGDVGHTLLFHGKAVRGDPRLHIRRTNELSALHHAASLKRSSQLAALVTSVKPEVAMVPLRALRSATQLARAGFHSTQGFVHSMQNGALRTPVNLHAEPTGDRLTDFLPRDGHKVLCPLCGDKSPDEHHYCSACASTAPIRTDLRAVVANLLSGVEAASFINMQLVDSLIFWFTEYVQASPGDAYAFVDPTDFAGTVGVRILLGESASGALALSQPAPTRLKGLERILALRQGLPTVEETPPQRKPVGPIDTSWASNFKWPLLLCTSSLFETLRFGAHRRAIRQLLSFPAGRFPLSQDAEGLTVFSPDPVCLCLLSKAPLPVLPARATRDLAMILAPSILYGTVGLALSWNRNSWQLDTVPPSDQDDLLDKAGLLPLNSSHPGKGAWASSLTWMAFLPSCSPLHQALQILGSRRARQAKLLICQTIAAAQHLAWNVVQDLTRQFLIREKRVEEAKAKGRPPPFFRPLFTQVSTHKALFPPSQQVENLATRYLASGGEVTSADFVIGAEELGIPVALRGSTWLRVVQTRVRLGTSGLKALRERRLPARRAPNSIGPLSAEWTAPEVTRGPRPCQIFRRKANPFGAELLSTLNTPSPILSKPSLAHALAPLPLGISPPHSTVTPPPLLGGITVREALASTSLEGGEVSVPDLSQSYRLFGTHWYHDEIFLELRDKLSLWANLVSPHQSWHVCSSDTFAQMSGEVTCTPSRLLDRVTGALAATNTAFFCHTPGHWVMVVARSCERTVTFYDSMANTLGGRSAGRAIIDYFNSNFPCSSNQGWLLVKGACDNQGNNSDCGPHSIANFIRAVYLASHGILYPMPPFPGFRMRVAAMLLSDSLEEAWSTSDPLL